VLAYKVLSEGRSRFTGWRWPLPGDDRPGAWVESREPPALCQSGVHACTVAQLPQWLGDELWRIELGGEILTTEPALVAARGRLLERVSEWDDPARLAFAEACARRAREGGDGGELLEMIERFAAARMAAATAYSTAVLAGERAAGRRSGSAYDAAFSAERAAQAQWLERELRLTDRLAGRAAP
jgi:hypothetical protein